MGFTLTTKYYSIAVKQMTCLQSWALQAGGLLPSLQSTQVQQYAGIPSSTAPPDASTGRNILYVHVSSLNLFLQLCRSWLLFCTSRMICKIYIPLSKPIAMLTTSGYSAKTLLLVLQRTCRVITLMLNGWLSTELVKVQTFCT